MVGRPHCAGEQDRPDPCGPQEQADHIGGGDPVAGLGELVLQLVEPHHGVRWDPVQEDAGKVAVASRRDQAPLGQELAHGFEQGAGLAGA